MRTKVVISGEPGVPSKVVPLTASEEAECDRLDAIHERMIAARVVAETKIAALVPNWDLAMASMNDQLGLLDTPQKRQAARIGRYWHRCRGKLRAVGNASAIQAVNMSGSDPFADGDGWPT